MGEYPKLMWSPDDVEIVVLSQKEQDTHEAVGYRLTRAPQGEAEAEPKKKAKK